MGNKMTVCFTNHHHHHPHQRDILHDGMISDPLDDLGHSFCYVRPDPNNNLEEETTSTTFRSISGASVSANTSTPLSTDVYLYHNSNSTSLDKASAFESSTSFASIPLQVLPRDVLNSGPLYSGPMENGYFSGPLFSGPMEKGGAGGQDLLKRSYSHAGYGYKRRLRKGSFIRVIKRVFSRTFGPGNVSSVAPVKNMGNMGHLGGLKGDEWVGNEKVNELTISSVGLSSEGSFFIDDENDSCLSQSQNLQWAQGKAGEDRVHVVVSEEHGWVFVGIYDGFNGPDAPDFLLSNMYQAVHKELKGLLWDDQENSTSLNSENQSLDVGETKVDGLDKSKKNSRYVHKQESYPYPSATEDLEMSKRRKRSKVRNRGAAKKWEENQRRWKVEFDRERLELDRRLREHMNSNGSKSVNHMDVLKALSRGLKKTEEAFLDIADQMLVENPELALMGSCVLVMLMKGEDVYVMNVGDSRAVLGQNSEPDLWSQDLEKINEETWYDLEVYDADIATTTNPSLTACQLSMDHSTSIKEEVQRIKSEHPDDPCAVINDRVKGSLKVTRAFGAGFLKQPKWNNALLEAFRIDYTGNAPYINCLPYLHHHRLGPRDRFLILSSDGLYQYFTNEEAVSNVEIFIQLSPEGDPAQHLVEEVLLRAAKKAGLDFHELLEIPQGDRRRYHDDVSIIVISLEGRLWRSCV